MLCSGLVNSSRYCRPDSEDTNQCLDHTHSFNSVSGDKMITRYQTVERKFHQYIVSSISSTYRLLNSVTCGEMITKFDGQELIGLWHNKSKDVESERQKWAEVHTREALSFPHLRDVNIRKVLAQSGTELFLPGNPVMVNMSTWFDHVVRSQRTTVVVSGRGSAGSLLV